MPYKDPDKQRSANAASERRRRAKVKLRLVKPVNPTSTPDATMGPVMAPSVRLRSASDVLSYFEQAHAVLANSGADGITAARTMISLASAAGKVIGDADVALEFESLKAEFARLKAGDHA